MKARKIFWGAFAIVSFLMMFVISYPLVRQWKVYSKGKIVNVTIIKLPSQYSKHGTLEFEFEGELHTIRSGGNTTLRAGDTLQLKYLESEHMFRYVNDNPLGWGLLVLLILLGCGIYCVNYAFRKDSPPIKL